MIGCSCVQAQVGVEVRVEAELKSHSAWRTDDETPPTTNGPSQSGIQQISRTALSAARNTDHPKITTLRHGKQQKLFLSTPILKLQNYWQNHERSNNKNTKQNATKTKETEP